MTKQRLLAAPAMEKANAVVQAMTRNAKKDHATAIGSRFDEDVCLGDHYRHSAFGNGRDEPRQTPSTLDSQAPLLRVLKDLQREVEQLRGEIRGKTPMQQPPIQGVEGVRETYPMGTIRRHQAT